MPISIDDLTMRQIIMDHYNHPIYKFKPKKKSQFIHVKSENCIDDIHVYLNLKNGVVVECSWDGIACVITTASTDIMCGLVINKKLKEALNIISEYLKMIDEQKINSNKLKEAVAFMNVHKQPARIKCATIGCYAIKNILLKNEKK